MRIHSSLALLCSLFFALPSGCSDSAEPTETEVESPSESGEDGPRRAGPPAPTMEASGESTARVRAGDRANAPAETPEPTETYAADAAEAPAIAIGQWARYIVHWRSGGESRMEMRIVDRQDDTWWVELSDVRRQRTQHMRMRVRHGENGRQDELLALEMFDGREVQRVPERMLDVQRQALAQWIAFLFPQDGEPIEDEVIVPGGRFQGCERASHSFASPQGNMNATVWTHRAVPLGGMIKLADADGGGHRIELSSFGLEGARSAFTR